MKYSKNTTGSYITWKLKQRRQGDKTMIFIHLEPYCFSENSRVAVFFWTIFIIRSGCNGKIYPPAMLVFLKNCRVWRIGRYGDAPSRKRFKMKNQRPCFKVKHGRCQLNN